MIAKKMVLENKLDDAMIIYEVIREYNELKRIINLKKQMGSKSENFFEWTNFQFERQVIRSNKNFEMATVINNNLFIDRYITDTNTEILIDKYGEDLIHLLRKIIDYKINLPGVYVYDYNKNQISLKSLIKQRRKYEVFQKIRINMPNFTEPVTILNDAVIIDRQLKKLSPNKIESIYGKDTGRLLNLILSNDIEQDGIYLLDLITNKIYSVDAIKELNN